VPKALSLAVPSIVAIYLLGTLALLVALPVGEVSGLQGVVEAASAMERRLGVPGLTPAIAFCVVVGSLGSVGAWLGAVARIPFVAGIDRFLPQAFGRIHPRWGTPHVALLTQSIVTVLFVILGQAGTTVKGAYEVLINMMIIISMIPFLFLYGAAVRLQIGEAGRSGEETVGLFRFRGGRALLAVLGVVGFATTTLATVLAFFPPPDEPNKPLAVLKIAGMTALMVGSGVLVFRFRTRRAIPGA
jgi:amino acid transporter